MSKAGGPNKPGFQKATPTLKAPTLSQPIKAGAHRAAPPTGIGAAKATTPTGFGGAVKALGKAVVGAKPALTSKATPGAKAPTPGAKTTKPTLTPVQKQNQRIDAINQILPGVKFKKH